MSEHLQALGARLEQGSAVVGQVGLGYVGLPVAALIASTGIEVIGLDLKEDRVRTINAGRSPIEGEEPGLEELVSEVTRSGHLRATTDAADLGRADLIMVAVETPVDDSDHRPRFAALRAACADIGRVLKPGGLVIIESTVSPGTVDRIVIPALEAASSQRAGVDFFVGHCPERVMPGRLLQNLREMSRVVGGQTPEVARVMATLYRRYVRGQLDVTDVLTAELVKTTENAYRDVNIAFANQVAMICESVGADVWKVREFVNKSPGRNMLLPGGGVGGHCIPKDPWLLAAAALEPGAVDVRLIEASRYVNDAMPAHVGRLVRELLSESGIEPAEARLAILGAAYLEDSDDTRNSPTQGLLDALAGQVAEVAVHDPFVAEYRGALTDVVRGADCAVVMVAHSEYRRADLARLAQDMRNPLLVDARCVFSPDALASAGFRWRTLGVGGRVPEGALID